MPRYKAGITVEGFSRAIAGIHALPIAAPAQWPELLRPAVCLLGAERASLFAPSADAHAGPNATVDLDPGFLSEYSSEWHRFDIWKQRAERAGLLHGNRVWCGEQVVPHREFVRSVVYNECGRRYSIGRVMCATIDASATPRAASTTVLSLFRSADKGTFSLAHRAAYEQLLPHLTQAMHTYWRLRATALTASLFDLLSKHGAAAMMLLDASLRIVYANTCAERELRKLDLLSVRNGRLVVRGPPRNRTMLEAGLRAAVSGTSFTHSFESATGDRSVQLTVVRLPPPIRDAWQWLKPAVLVLLQPVRHGDTRTAASTIARNHGLSGAELRVLEQVLLARSRKAIAAELRISTNTVQSHLRSIFSKTHVSSQRELLRMVLSITARDGESEY